MEPEDLTTLSEAMRLASLLESWIKSVRSTVQDQLEVGAPVSGYKLVKKRATRKWASDEEMLDRLKKMRSLKAVDYSIIKMCTPPQLEKICKAKGVDFDKFGAYIVKTSTGNTVAHEDDKRPAVVVAGEREIPEHLAKKMLER